MKEDIQKAMKAAMKAGDKVRTSILRMILADIQSAELAGQQMADGLTGFAKRVEKSIEEYQRLGKEEEVAKLRKEREVVGEFLPEKLSDEALDAAVDEVINTEGLTSMKDFGRGMKAVMSAYGVQADGKKVSELLKRKLGDG
jgi:uncharacterized protein YqeY